MINESTFDNKKDLILNSVFEEIAAKGLRGTSIRSIADRANISKSNIHYYFDSKEQLLEILQDRLLSSFQSRRKAAMDRAENTLEGHVEVFFEQKKHMVVHTLEQDLVNKEFWLRAHSDENIRIKVRNNYRSWRGDFISILNKYTDLQGEDLNMISLLMVSMLEGIALQYYVEDTINIEGYLKYCNDFLLKLIERKSIEEE